MSAIVHVPGVLAASAPTPLPLAPAWWDAAPGSAPSEALYLAAGPRARATAPLGFPRPHDVALQVAREALRGALAPPVLGPEEAARRASAALAARRRAPEPLADAYAAALGGLVRISRDEAGRPAARLDPAGFEAVGRALASRLALFRPPRRPAPGWARRSVAQAWLATRGRRAHRAFGAWAEAAAEAAAAAPDGLPEALARAWLALAELLADAPEAGPVREDVARAREAGAVSALVDDGGRLALALFPAGLADPSRRLRAHGLRPLPLRPDPSGLVLHA